MGFGGTGEPFERAHRRQRAAGAGLKPCPKIVLDRLGPGKHKAKQFAEFLDVEYAFEKAAVPATDLDIFEDILPTAGDGDLVVQSKIGDAQRPQTIGTRVIGKV